jgi:hypothetical protein
MLRSTQETINPRFFYFSQEWFISEVNQHGLPVPGMTTGQFTADKMHFTSSSITNHFHTFVLLHVFGSLGN